MHNLNQNIPVLCCRLSNKYNGMAFTKINKAKISVAFFLVILFYFVLSLYCRILPWFCVGYLHMIFTYDAVVLLLDSVLYCMLVVQMIKQETESIWEYMSFLLSQM